MLAQATTLLRQTTAVRAHGTTIPIDDGPIAAVLGGPDGANRAIALLDLEIAAADRSLASRIDPRVADQRLRDAIGASEGANAAGSWFDAFIDFIASRLAGLFSGLRVDVPDLNFLPYVIAAFGLGFVALIVAILGRGTRERIRREVLLPSANDRRADDPIVHLRSAEAAIARGQARDAIRELYLYVIGSLAAHEVLRFDAALTDRELLARAAGIPNADALESLVAIYERSWFGLREPDADEALRARALAHRVMP